MTLPFAQSAFEVTAHLSSEWLLVFLLALTPVTIIEVGKLLRAYFDQPERASVRFGHKN